MSPEDVRFDFGCEATALTHTHPEGYPPAGALAVIAGALMDGSGLEDIERLGAGWCGDEALAISVACAVGGIDDAAEAMLTAVNHSGDSDSTGSITGNILGAALGHGWLPQTWLDELELRDVIVRMAEDLDTALRRTPDDIPLDWAERYPRAAESAARPTSRSRFVAELADMRITTVEEMRANAHTSRPEP